MAHPPTATEMPTDTQLEPWQLEQARTMPMTSHTPAEAGAEAVEEQRRCMEDMGQAACHTILTEGAEVVVVERVAEDIVAAAEAELEEEEEEGSAARCHRLGCSIQRLWRVRPIVATIAMVQLAITVREAGMVIMRASRAMTVVRRVWRGVSGGLVSGVPGTVRIVGAVVIEGEVIMGVESPGERIL